MSRLNGSVVKERFHCAVIGQWKRTQVMDCFVWEDLGEWGEVPKGSSDPFFLLSNNPFEFEKRAIRECDSP